MNSNEGKNLPIQDQSDRTTPRRGQSRRLTTQIRDLAQDADCRSCGLWTSGGGEGMQVRWEDTRGWQGHVCE